MLQTLGSLKLTDSDLGRPLPLLLLAYLDYEGGWHDRRALARLFWPEQPLNDTLLSPTTKHLLDWIEQAFSIERAGEQVVFVKPQQLLPGVFQSERTFEEAQNSLQLHGYIARYKVEKTTSNWRFTYGLTSTYRDELLGQPPLERSQGKLRNVLYKLRALGLIVEEGKRVQSAVASDYHLLSKALEAGDATQARRLYKPFLQGVERSLAANNYVLGADLAIWLEHARLTLEARVRVPLFGAARECVLTGHRRDVERYVFSALGVGERPSYEALDEALILLNACGSERAAEASERFGEVASHRSNDAPQLSPTAHTPTAFTPDMSALKERAWTLSQGHLAPLLDVSAYGPDGALRKEPAPRKYHETLYVPPAESRTVEQFFRSEKRVLLLVGRSGSGKSNLLCHSFLNEVRKGNPALFISARLLFQPEIGAYLRTQLLSEVAAPWRGNVTQFGAWLREQDASFCVYVDAVNEFNRAGGPLALLRELMTLASDVTDPVKFVVSCRSETWREFQELLGERSSESVLEGFPHAEFVLVEGFDDEDDRQRLFAKYQAYHQLVPERYEAQTGSLKQMIRSPFLMSVVAETYTNRETDHQRRIPKKLNFFRIFRSMTDRKLADANYLLSASNPKRALFEPELQRCLYSFATSVYQKSLDAKGSSDDTSFMSVDGDRTDALSVRQLSEKQFAPFFTPFGGLDQISVFEALVQLNLIEETVTLEPDAWGEPRQTKAYRFFHDQYAQYWLSAVLSSAVLGRVSSELFTSTHMLGQTAQGVANLLGQAGQAPLLVGALEHWFYANMADAQGLKDYLVPLFDRLGAEGSGLAPYYVSAYLFGLVEKGTVEARQLFSELFPQCGAPLKQALALHFLELWPEVAPSDLQAFMGALHERRDRVTLRVLGELFADLYAVDPKRVAAVIDATLHGSETPWDLLSTGVLRRQEFAKQLTFLAHFGLKVLLYGSLAGPEVEQLTSLLTRKYSYLFEALTTDRSVGLRAGVRELLYKKLEESGETSWNQAASAQGNDTFFSADCDGVVQKDLLKRYYTYMVALHNGKLDELTLSEDSDFGQLTFRLLTYRPGSVVGYVSSVITALLIVRRVDHFDPLLAKLLSFDRHVARLSLGSIATTVSLIDSGYSEHILRRLQATLLPHQLAGGYESEEVVPSFISVAATDLLRCESGCRATLTTSIEVLEGIGDQRRVDAFGERLANANFHPNISVGTMVIDQMLRAGGLESPLWRDATLLVMGGMLARHPKTVDALLQRHDKDERVVVDARQRLSDQLVKRKDEVNYQMAWNRFLATGCASTKLRYYIIKVLVGGLVQSNCADDFVKEIRRFFVELARGYLTDQRLTYDFLSEEEALLSAQTAA